MYSTIHHSLLLHTSAVVGDDHVYKPALGLTIIIIHEEVKVCHMLDSAWIFFIMNDEIFMFVCYSLSIYWLDPCEWILDEETSAQRAEGCKAGSVHKVSKFNETHRSIYYAQAGRLHKRRLTTVYMKETAGKRSQPSSVKVGTKR